MKFLSKLTDPAAVRTALSEFDQIGRERFLDRYGFGPAKMYFLKIDHKYYDSKAIVGAAYRYQHPEEKSGHAASDFSGGEATVARKLTQLGFIVVRRDAGSDIGRKVYDQAPRCWVLLTFGGDRQYGGNAGYEDSPSKFYKYDSFVANSKAMQQGDTAIVCDRKYVIGVGRITTIDEHEGKKEQL
jgi:hypothetical protein